MSESAAPCEHKRTFHNEGEGVVMCQDCDEVLMITSRSDAPLLDATREVAE